MQAGLLGRRGLGVDRGPCPGFPVHSLSAPPELTCGVSKGTYATFGSAVFTGLFFVFSLYYGVDPTDLKGTILSTVVPAVVPSSAPFVGAVGVILSIAAFFGLIRWVLVSWEKQRVRGVAVLTGLLAGGLTIPAPTVAVWFWVMGAVVSAL